MAKEVTEFGKELRKLRIDRGDVLKKMADALGCTSSYLSAIECGKRGVPSDLIPRIQALYGLDDEQVARLEAARDSTLSNVKLDLEGASGEQRDVALMFARTFKSLSREEIEEMKRFLSKASEEGEGDDDGEQ